MTRWLALVAMAALLAGSVQAGATEMDVDDPGDTGGCGPGSQQICLITKTEICTEWTWVSGGGSIDPSKPGGGGRLECKTKQVYEKKDYYR
jgi:hypothetical protein